MQGYGGFRLEGFSTLFFEPHSRRVRMHRPIEGPKCAKILGGYMLGEKIGDSAGKVIVRRVLPSQGGSPKVETSFQASSSLLGVEVMETGTYTATVRPD